MNSWVKGSAKELASRGYITLAADLYRGRATAFLRSRKDVLPAQIGAIGWCMGGGYALVTALNDSELAACVICYGRLVTDSLNIAKIPCPTMGLFGEEDQGITPQSVREFEKACKQLGKKIDVTIYPKAGHAFMNPNNKAGYRQSSADDAWQKIYNFFSNTLAQKP